MITTILKSRFLVGFIFCVVGALVGVFLAQRQPAIMPYPVKVKQPVPVVFSDTTVVTDTITRVVYLQPFIVTNAHASTVQYMHGSDTTDCPAYVATLDTLINCDTLRIDQVYNNAVVKTECDTLRLEFTHPQKTFLSVVLKQKAQEIPIPLQRLEITRTETVYEEIKRPWYIDVLSHGIVAWLGYCGGRESHRL